MSELLENIKSFNEKLQLIKKELSKKIIGQEKFISSLFYGILADGHILVEGMPGLGKTLAVKSFSKLFNLGFSRIQFTPDLLPSDIIGTVVYNQKKMEFETVLGPIFSNIVLADEINRAPAKVQSALLQVMEERIVTIEKNSYKLKQPFLVLATQNPIDNSGTYRLPEAQMDRFFMKIVIDYPSDLEEFTILKLKNKDFDNIELSKFDYNIIIKSKDLINKIVVDDKILNYIVKIINATRKIESINSSFLGYINFGASPRGSIALLNGAKITAFFNNRDFVIPDDVKAVANMCLNHRISLSYEAEVDGYSAENIISEILMRVKI